MPKPFTATLALLAGMSTLDPRHAAAAGGSRGFALPSQRGLNIGLGLSPLVHLGTSSHWLGDTNLVGPTSPIIVPRDIALECMFLPEDLRVVLGAKVCVPHLSRRVLLANR